MFRDESSHVIRKATSKSRKSSAQSAGRVTSSLSHSGPTKLTWSPTQSNRGSSPTESDKTFSTSVGTSSAFSPPGSRSPPGCLTLDFGCPSTPQRETKAKVPPEYKLAPSTTDLPAPTACLFAPNAEDRGLHLFVARYVTVVSNKRPKVKPNAISTCLLTSTCGRTKHAVISNMTCKPSMLI